MATGRTLTTRCQHIPHTSSRTSGPDPGSLPFPANDGGHVLFERGDTQFQVLREVLQQATLLVQKQPEPQQVGVLLHTEIPHMKGFTPTTAHTLPKLTPPRVRAHKRPADSHSNPKFPTSEEENKENSFVLI